MQARDPSLKLPAIQIADSIQRGNGEYTFEKRRFCPPISFTVQPTRVCVSRSPRVCVRTLPLLLPFFPSLFPLRLAFQLFESSEFSSPRREILPNFPLREIALQPSSPPLQTKFTRTLLKFLFFLLFQKFLLKFLFPFLKFGFKKTKLLLLLIIIIK